MNRKSRYTTAVLFGRGGAAALGDVSHLYSLLKAIIDFEPFAKQPLFARASVKAPKNWSSPLRSGQLNDRLLNSWEGPIRKSGLNSIEFTANGFRNMDKQPVFGSICCQWESERARGRKEQAAGCCITLAVEESVAASVPDQYISVAMSIAKALSSSYGFMEASRTWGVPLCEGSSMIVDLMDVRWQTVPYEEFRGRYHLAKYIPRLRWGNFIRPTHLNTSFAEIKSQPLVAEVTKVAGSLHFVRFTSDPESNQRTYASLQSKFRLVPEGDS